MKRLFVLSLCSALCLVAQKKQPTTQEFAAKIKALRQSIVEIWVKGHRNGTGFVVSDRGHILTAIHVVGSVAVANNKLAVNYNDQIEAVFNDGMKLPAIAIQNPREDWPYYDMALLKVERKGTVPLELAPNPTIPDGSDVYLTGFPFDLPKAVTYRGTVASTFPIQVGVLNGNPVYSNQIQIQAPIAKGFSGCPLLEYRTDKVIGVIVTKLGGITQGLQGVAQDIQKNQRSGTVHLMGVDPNSAILQLIAVMDTYLSAGSGFAVSVEYISSVVKQQVEEKK